MADAELGLSTDAAFYSVLANSFWLVTVGMLWGCTNPFIKLGSKGVQDLDKRSHPLLQFLSETVYLFTRWQYVLPFAINMMGSVLFFWSLGSSDISLVVPITNSLTFLFTTLTGQLLGEKSLAPGAYLGMLCVLFGISICVLSKSV
ncbi:DnaJ (Hsp40), subfamily C, member 2 [Balamuthia mandrillaris]